MVSRIMMVKDRSLGKTTKLVNLLHHQNRDVRRSDLNLDQERMKCIKGRLIEGYKRNLGFHGFTS